MWWVRKRVDKTSGLCRRVRSPGCEQRRVTWDQVRERECPARACKIPGLWELLRCSASCRVGLPDILTSIELCCMMWNISAEAESKLSEICHNENHVQTIKDAEVEPRPEVRPCVVTFSAKRALLAWRRVWRVQSVSVSGMVFGCWRLMWWTEMERGAPSYDLCSLWGNASRLARNVDYCRSSCLRYPK